MTTTYVSSRLTWYLLGSGEIEIVDVNAGEEDAVARVLHAKVWWRFVERDYSTDRYCFSVHIPGKRDPIKRLWAPDGVAVEMYARAIGAAL